MNLFCEKSDWIWLDASDDCNRYMELTAQFSASAEGAVQLHLSAEGQYVAFINGIRVNSTQYSDFPQAKSVQCPDVTALVKSGENTLVIQAWYPGEDTSVTRLEAPGLRAEVWQEDRLLYATGAHSKVRPMTQYRTGKMQRITGQLGFSFEVSAAEEAEYRDAVCVDKPAQCVPRPIKELRVEDSAPAKLVSQGTFRLLGGENIGEQMQTAGLYWQDVRSMTKQETTLPSESGVCFRAENGDGIYLVYDLGRNYEGYFEMDVVCPEQVEVDLGYGEHLEDLRARTSVGGRCFAMKLTAGPERKMFVHWFRRLGGRYLQLFIHSHEATVYAMGLRAAYYPVNCRPIAIKDKLHQRIAEVSRDTLIACMHEHYEDCPWREQALYAFDSRNQMLAGYYAFGEYDFARENLRLLALSQREDGLLELCAPARIPITIPSFSMAFIIALEEHVRHSGNVDFGREMLPVAERILDALAGQVHDGLAWRFTAPKYWNFYEWQPLLDGGKITRGEDEVLPESAEAGLQMFGLLALQRMRVLREAVGSEPCEKERALEAELLEGLEKFWSEEDQAYASYINDGERVQYAELIQSLAVYGGFCAPERAHVLREKLKTTENLVPVTLAYSLFKYEALLQDERNTDMVFDEIAEKWGGMLFRGATTFWEVEEGAPAFDNAGSLCHGWSAIPLYLYNTHKQLLPR